ncbi:hypothetical protein AUC43_15510 [Hymenobacter sedentarius]|uniref:Histidine kinase/HSP90-like ATPase domain-containing protein n=2 Tax=Hymenobacter sedentarius TaxID=1411621 RepID=A0A0U4ASE4_9BACT|nr:hypothetical protein AUC43_15510 [Hymenobacter sedentarius]
MYSTKCQGMSELNTLRHASGGAHLRIQLCQQDGNLVLVVEDDGGGFATSPPPDGTAARGMGLRSIGVRVETLGAEPKQHSAPGLGTRTRIQLAHP